MDASGLDRRVVALWQAAAEDLGIRVTAPVELRDASDQPFVCEAFVRDFGSPAGAMVVSAKTERRVRRQLRSLEGRIWLAVSEHRPPAAYNRNHVIAVLLDWGWFGPPGEAPDWYSRRAWR